MGEHATYTSASHRAQNPAIVFDDGFAVEPLHTSAAPGAQ